jgi:heme-degrading monooxygenase HmoA
MFVIVSTYKARVGEEDAIIALHEDWQRTQHVRTRGYLSGELLRSVSDAGQFIAILRFVSQESARALANDPERKAWHQRLVSLIEHLPVLSEYTSEWSQTT